MKKMAKYPMIVIIAAFFMHSCKEEKKYLPASIPANPYDTIDYGGDVPDDSVDAASFVGLHKYIFSTTCAVPGCHDGSFEPDFRTVQSAYNTLVYHQVAKNDASNSFEYRVVPGDHLKSWLYERITTDDATLGRMPLYDTLSKHEIDLITNWIKTGAKDAFGNSPILPTYLPSFFGLLMFENDTSGYRYDSTRASIIDPVELPKNKNIDIWIGLFDQDADGKFLPASDFTYNKYKISNHLYEFISKPELPLTVLPGTKPYMGVNPFGQGKAPYYHHFTINTANYPVNQRQYFRIYVQDKDHSSPIEIPSDGSPIYLLTYFSFIVK
jgi:hypothetical protein